MSGVDSKSLSISVVGGISVAFQGRDVKIRSRKSRAVLAYLALSEAGRESRERLVGLLWSETEEEKARASLRQTLVELRRACDAVGFAGLQTAKLTVELDRDALDVDILSAIRDAEAHRVHPVLLDSERLTDSLLRGFDDIDPSFRSWVLAKRQTLQDRLIRIFEDELRGDAAGESRKLAAQVLLSLDPTHEEAARVLMRTRAQGGDVPGALRTYKMLWDLLDEDYDMEPSTSTQELVAEIKQGRFDAPASAAEIQPGAPLARVADATAVPTPALPAARIALLVRPFETNGVQAEKMHLVQGFRHHLIASLVRFREWSVIDEAASGPSHARPVAARYDVDATAYQAGNVVNLVLTLRQEDIGQYVWSDSFELKIESWFEAQQRVIRRIATYLNVQLSMERLMRLAGEPDVALDIYDRWLRAQAMLSRFDPGSWERATSILTDAMRRAPAFSPCFSSFVQMRNSEHFTYPGRFRDLTQAIETLELAKRAVQLDPVDSRAQLCLGWSYTLLKRYAEGEVHMDLARDLNESDPWTLMSTALFYGFCGEVSTAMNLASDSMKLSLAPDRRNWGYHAIVQFMCGNYEQALTLAAHAQDVIKTLPVFVTAAHFHLGHQREAEEEAGRFSRLIRETWFGSDPPTDRDIARWALHAHPIRHSADWERLRDGLQGAGIPAAECRHQVW